MQSDDECGGHVELDYLFVMARWEGGFDGYPGGCADSFFWDEMLTESLVRAGSEMSGI